MRQIGTIPRELDPRALTDHLTTLDITTRVDERPDGWTIWVLNEDHLARARQELEEFVKNPANPHYESAKVAAETIRKESQKLDRQFRKNYREMSGYWDRPQFRRRPLTVVLIAVSVLVFLGGDGLSRRTSALYNKLEFCSFFMDEDGQPVTHGLGDILSGEVWRLVTPIFLHFGIVHILFNMWALSDIATIIEYRRGTLVLATLVLVSAIISNCGQYFYDVRVFGAARPFGGMSGVLYALFGYLWMKGLYEPEQGMILHPRTVRFMLLWLVLCFTGALGPIANAAHVVGLVVGVLFGLARF